MFHALNRIDHLLPEEVGSWWNAAVELLRAQGAGSLGRVLPALPRRIGRAPLAPEVESIEGCTVDWGAWRLCDLAALALLETCEPEAEIVLDLYLHGDMEERTMVMRSQACLAVGDATVRLLGEAQRTNTLPHFEAAVCDSNLVVRALEHPAFVLDELNRLVLKLAFLDLPLARMFGVEMQANEELSRMIQGLASEREAAGRMVWRDTNRIIARAPCAGTLARIIGGLEHGDDEHRLAAAEGLPFLVESELADIVRARLKREPCERIRSALELYLDRMS